MKSPIPFLSGALASHAHRHIVSQTSFLQTKPSHSPVALDISDLVKRVCACSDMCAFVHCTVLICFTLNETVRPTTLPDIDTLGGMKRDNQRFVVADDVIYLGSPQTMVV